MKHCMVLYFDNLLTFQIGAKIQMVISVGFWLLNLRTKILLKEERDQMEYTIHKKITYNISRVSKAQKAWSSALYNQNYQYMMKLSKKYNSQKSFKKFLQAEPIEIFDLQSL